MRNKIREQTINYLIEEFKPLPYQEYIIRKMWESKNYLIPVRASGWSSTRVLLTMIDILIRKDKDK